MFQCPVRLGLTGTTHKLFRFCLLLIESKPFRHRNPEQLYGILDDAGLGEPRDAWNVEGMDQIRFEATGNRSE